MFEERLYPMDWDFILSSDVVGLYTMTCTVRRVMQHYARIKAHNPNIVTITGGTHPSEMPEDTLRFCDFVVPQGGRCDPDRPAGRPPDRARSQHRPGHLL